MACEGVLNNPLLVSSVLVLVSCKSAYGRYQHSVPMQWFYDSQANLSSVVSGIASAAYSSLQ